MIVPILRLIITGLLLLASLLWSWWHWRIRHDMSFEDRAIRGGFLSLMLSIAAGTLGAQLGWDLWWRLTWVAASALLIAVGMVALVVKRVLKPVPQVVVDLSDFLPKKDGN